MSVPKTGTNKCRRKATATDQPRQISYDGPIRSLKKLLQRNAGQKSQDKIVDGCRTGMDLLFIIYRDKDTIHYLGIRIIGDG